MTIAGIIAGMSATGYDTVEDIVATHTLQYFLQTDGISVVLDLLINHTPIAPVVDNDGHLAGFVGEEEILEALYKGKNVGELKAEDLMKKDRISAVTETASISDVLRLFLEKKLQIVPITRDGRVIKSITKHDLIRAMTGAGLGVEHQ